MDGHHGDHGTRQSRGHPASTALHGGPVFPDASYHDSKANVIMMRSGQCSHAAAASTLSTGPEAWRRRSEVFQRVDPTRSPYILQ